MTKTLHTPGPWQTSGDLYTDRIEIWSSLPDGRKGFLLADLPNDSNDDGDRAQVEANARLLAKAPELLAQLRKVVALYVGLIRSDYQTGGTPDPETQTAWGHHRAVALLAEIDHA